MFKFSFSVYPHHFVVECLNIYSFSSLDFMLHVQDSRKFTYLRKKLIMLLGLMNVRSLPSWLKNFDMINAIVFFVLQSLSHVAPLRNYFLSEANYKKIKRPPGDLQFLLVQRFGELIRKLWNPCNFKAHVSPHEMLQSVVLCSKKKFQITQQGMQRQKYLVQSIGNVLF